MSASFAHPLRLSLLSLSLALAWSAQAQTATPEKLDTVRVTGQGANLRGALDKQRAALGVMSVVHADAIGALPDNNAAEALARLPGVSVERDQGEGRFIRVRGMGPDYNAVTINGATVPASEAERRAPGLDVVPAGLIRSLVVAKTLTPADDANSIGGSVAVNTLSAFDLAGKLLSLDLGANHDANAGKTRPRGSLTFADRFLGNTLGLALALSADQRRFASDNVETGGAWDGSKLEEFELRRYEILRERLGAAINLDYKPAQGRHFYLRGFASQFDDTETRQSQAIEFDDAQASGALGKASVLRGLKSRVENNRSNSLVLGSHLALSDWQLNAEAGQGRASEAKPNALASSAFKSSFSGVGFSGTQRPQLLGPATLAGTSGYALDKFKIEDSKANDRVRHAKLDLQREFELAGGAELELKTGLKATRRDKRNEQETYAYSAKNLSKAGIAKSALAMDQFLAGGAVDYAWGSFGPALNADALRRLVSGLDPAKFRDAVDSSSNDFAMQEDVDAGYAQLRWERGGTQLLGGLRYERIAFSAEGFAALDDVISASKANTRSSHWLPALLLRQDLMSKNTQLRAALTNSVLRPSFGQLSPGRVVDGDEAELGNPLLKPLRSRNLDLGIEHALGQGGRDGAISAYVFQKNIKDFVFQTDLAGSKGWEAFSAVHSYANGDKATVRGLELAYSQLLRQLPAPLNGLIVGANATFVDSTARIGGFDGGQWKSREISLPSQSDRTLNLSLGWEGHGLSTRLALNHKSPYLLEVGDVFDAARDLKVDSQKQVDFSLRYQLNPRVELSFEALNLANAKYYVYQADKARNAQFEQYGRSIKIGVKAAVF
ncbi:TonB-dependent receptor [Kinneretia asaccharophila]|uniref:TonB-dependent receptor n=1 Tax=Roseateles asaccharophilus TaxID=582607 RepID=A0A4R6NBZ5_9BURK|nr:TonB-dependent receptor [Roseateles asaccharophilus]MDN3543153.1 TonB-dependent receptor [Roseateles asaccharophilus]TDP13148.1 TonB-dependent receptor [Roseateles asaccharophilus]